MYANYLLLKLFDVFKWDSSQLEVYGSLLDWNEWRISEGRNKSSAEDSCRAVWVVKDLKILWLSLSVGRWIEGGGGKRKSIKVKSFHEAVIFRLHYSLPFSSSLLLCVANNKHFCSGSLRCIIKSLHEQERFARELPIHNSRRWHNTNVSLQRRAKPSELGEHDA